ncbi:MAG: signal recognition particle-docking protein FtsY [Chloroflexia bacterium]
MPIWPRKRADAEASVEKTPGLEEGLARTRQGFLVRLTQLFRRGRLDEEDWEELEALLIQADVGVETTQALLARLRERARQEKLSDGMALREALSEEMRSILRQAERPVRPPEPGVPYVILVVGVNGVGKTTTIAKLAYFHRRQGRTVLLAAADTFRAAAIEQLQVWGERAGVPVLAHRAGGDPAAVAHDAVAAALARGIDVVIVDTAGRLHTKHNLMEELRKVRRVIERQLPGAPQQVLLVLDATTGQNGLVQARVFTEAVQVTHLALAKLDGTAKGGIAFAVVRELGLPIAYVGTGERLEDLVEFDAERFVAALLG